MTPEAFTLMETDKTVTLNWLMALWSYLCSRLIKSEVSAKFQKRWNNHAV